MRVAVLQKGAWKVSKFNYGRNRRVTFEDIDNPRQYVYLNITEEHGIVDKWDPYIVAGNVLNVPIIEGTNQVNKFGDFQVIKEVNKEEIR